ncbi:MAG TPA: hypothetical protein VK508_01790 [Cyclobacteriaceae bacterium]|nr:hypothetical protein [Cyclobacteriaceae bacterium]
MEVIAKRAVLIRQDLKEGKRVDVRTVKGKKINLTEEEAIKFWGVLDLSDEQKKKLNTIAKRDGYKRRV